MKKLRKLSIVIVFFCIVTIHSCDNSLEPLDKDTGIFAIYGFLDLNEQIHYIRVRDLNAPFTKEATETINATVTLHNLTLGSSIQLESNRQEFQGVYQHNFLFSGNVIPDNEYLIRIERSDGITVEANTRTPTMPDPMAEPLNRNCFVPIEFSMEPMNGGTVVLRVGLGPLEGEPWGVPRVIIPDSQGKVAFTFTPHDQVIEILPGFITTRRCGNHLRTGNIYVSYIHYGPGFYEQIAIEAFDIFGSTSKFGALYYDTLAVPVDTSRVCPQDC